MLCPQVLEYAARGDLFTELKRRGGQLNEKIVVKFVLHPFLSVLSFLHSKGIVHRDIKPENILFSQSRVLKARGARQGRSRAACRRG